MYKPEFSPKTSKGLIKLHFLNRLENDVEMAQKCFLAQRTLDKLPPATII